MLHATAACLRYGIPYGSVASRSATSKAKGVPVGVWASEFDPTYSLQQGLCSGRPGYLYQENNTFPTSTGTVLSRLFLSLSLSLSLSLFLSSLSVSVCLSLSLSRSPAESGCLAVLQHHSYILPDELIVAEGRWEVSMQSACAISTCHKSCHIQYSHQLRLMAHQPWYVGSNTQMPIMIII